MTTTTPAATITAQLRNPGDIFSILLILGGDVVCRAIAQLAGTRIAPVAFSFGARFPATPRTITTTY